MHAMSTSLSSSNDLASLINNIQKTQLSLTDWQSEKLNFIPLRGSWFANSEADFDLEAEIDKFISPQNNKKVMLLMGDSGAGKSLFTQGLANKLWQNFSAQSPIPIWISLPSLKDPVNRAIEESLERYGFKKDQIEELRKTRSFVFIFDAYDEIRCEQNLYQTNNFDKWNAKIIITCRREYLYHKDNYKLFFAPFIGDKIQYTQYEEIYIRPFNANQIQTYVNQYIKTQGKDWKEPEKYVSAIEEISGLKELIKTPFILKLTMEVLPQIVEKYATHNIQERKKVTQAALYDVFIEQWFIRQEMKLKEAKLIKEGEKIKPEFWAYAKELALEMHKANLTQVVYNANEESDLFSTEVKENPWEKFFTPKNPRMELLKTACLVRETSQYHYAFVHLSLLEYFLTRNLYEKLTANLDLDKSEKIVIKSTDDKEKSKQDKMIIKDKSVKQKQEDYFNLKLIVKESTTLQFLADRVGEQLGFKEVLFERVYSSRNNSQNKIAAANAITILNRANVAFSGMDLSNIQIPNADLSGSLMHGTNFYGADLQSVDLSNTYLCDANLNNSNLTEVELGQLPFREYDDSVKAISYAKNDRLLVMAIGKNIVVMDQNTGETNSCFKGHTDKVESIAISPDSKLLVSGSSDKTIRLWEIESKNSHGLSLSGHAEKVMCVAFSPNGKYFASGGWDDSLCLWEILSDNQAHLIITTKFDSSICSVDFSPNGKYLACGEFIGTVNLWELESKRTIESWENHTDIVNSLKFSPDGRLLASGSVDKTICIWELSSRLLIGQLKGHTDRVNCVAFSSDSNLLASCGHTNDSKIFFWDVTNKQIINILHAHKSSVNSIMFNGNSTLLVSSGDDNTVKFWKPQINEYLKNQVKSHTDRVKKVIFSADNKLVISGSEDKTVRLWEVESQQLIHKAIINQQKEVNDVALRHDCKQLVSACNEYPSYPLRLWVVDTQQVLGQPLVGHNSEVISVAFNYSGKLLASGSRDAVIHLWLVDTQKLLDKTFQGHTDRVTSVIFSHDDNFLASGSFDNTVRLWDVKSIKNITTFKGHTDRVTFVTFHPNDRSLASASYDHTVRIWDTKSLQFIAKLEGHSSVVTSVGFNTDGTLLVSNGWDRAVRLWAVENWQCIEIYNINEPIINACFSDNSNYIVAGCGHEIGLLQRQNKKLSKSNYCLIWYSGSISLSADRLHIINVHGISKNNYQLLVRLGAIASELPVKKVNTENDKLLTRENNFKAAMAASRDKDVGITPPAPSQSNKPTATISSNLVIKSEQVLPLAKSPAVIKPAQASPAISPAAVIRNVGIYSQPIAEVKTSSATSTQQIQQNKIAIDSKKETKEKSISYGLFSQPHSSKDKDDKEKKSKKDKKDKKEERYPSNKKT